MKSFGPLLRELRGTVPLREVGRRCGLSYSYLAKVEAGRKVLGAERARRVLRDGFGYPDAAAESALIQVGLRDLGLKDPALRRLVAGLVEGSLPDALSRSLSRMADRYRVPEASSAASPRRLP